jgi:DNA-binding transcriptional MerR regulator
MQVRRNSPQKAIKSIGIGALARLSGCSIPTIRYYEEIGLIAAPMRSAGGHRVYGVATQERLRFIRRCRDFGFSVEKVRELLNVADSALRDCDESVAIVRERLQQIETKMAELRLLRGALRTMVETCSSDCASAPATPCRIVDDISCSPCLERGEVMEPRNRARKS